MLKFSQYLSEAKMAVASANLKSFSYNADEETLDIWFRSGGVYRYEGVPEDVVNAMKFAESRGRFFWLYIRTTYPYTQLKHSRPGFTNAYNTGPTSTHLRHTLKVPPPDIF